MAGVKTYVFGRFVWIVLEGLADAFDLMMEEETSEERRQSIIDKFKEIICLVGFVLPCIYCRQSFQSFTDPHNVESPNTDVNRLLSIKGGGKRLIYNLHNRVSIKLRDQERNEYKGDRTRLKAINAKWKKHMISFDHALKTQFPSVTSFRFWNAFFTSFALMVCDWRETECNYILRFVTCVGEFMLMSRDEGVQQYGTAYMLSLKDTLSDWKRKMDLAMRIDIVSSVQKSMYAHFDWEVTHTPASLTEKCEREAIVGCVK